MTDLVLCTYCRSEYDLERVTVIARYADCSTFKTPCCNHDADTRTWVSLPSYRGRRGTGRGPVLAPWGYDKDADDRH